VSSLGTIICLGNGLALYVPGPTWILGSNYLSIGSYLNLSVLETKPFPYPVLFVEAVVVVI
jgi:hypothetical protein